MLKRTLFGTGLLAATGLSWWLLTQVEQREAAPDTRQAHLPDFFLDDFVLNVMGVDGKPRHRISAPHMQHYRDDDTSELEQPHIEVYREEGPDWHIDALSAWVSSGGDKVILKEDVKVNRQPATGYAPLTLLTEELTILPNRDYMETDLPVTFLSPGWTVDATGMQSWLQEGRMMLLSQVRGTHEPTSP